MIVGPLSNDGFSGLTSAKRTLLAAGLILVLSLVAYSNSFDASFQYDDYHQIVQNPFIRDIGNIPRYFTNAGMESFHEELKGYRPVTHTSFAVNYALSGLNVRGYHIVNFLLHILNAFFVYLIACLVFKEGGVKAGPAAALFASLLFAVHPIQTSAVTYVSGRAVLLAVSFYLIAFYGFVRVRSGVGRPYAWALVMPLLFLAALLSKEMAVSLVAVMLAYDLIFTAPAAGASRPGGKWLYYVPFIAALVFYLFVKKALQGSFAEADRPYGVYEYLLSELKALLVYVRLLILPMNQTIVYDLPSTRAVDAGVAVSALLAAGVLYALYRARKSSPATAFFGLWFFLTLAPESTFVPISDIAVEYRLYLPSAGFLAAAVLIISGMVKRPGAFAGLCSAVLVLFIAATFQRNTVMHDNYTIWSDAAKKSPWSSRVHANLGAALMNKGLCYEAIPELKRSIEIDPFYSESYYVFDNMGVCFYKLDMMTEAKEKFELAAKANPGDYTATGYIGAINYEQGNFVEAAEAFEKTLKLNPDFYKARLTLAMCYDKMGRYQDAVATGEAAARYSPGDYSAHYNLAVIYQDSGMQGKALDEAGTALSLAGDETQSRDAESIIYELKGGG